MESYSTDGPYNARDRSASILNIPGIHERSMSWFLAQGSSPEQLVKVMQTMEPHEIARAMTLYLLMDHKVG
ncbi:MAG: hypothetical protein ABIH34_05325, partial [Nanoarchaeota archaeon]